MHLSRSLAAATATVLLAAIMPQLVQAREIVGFSGAYSSGTVVVKTSERTLYYVLGNGQAVRYRVGVGRFSFRFYMVNYPDPRQRRVEWHLAEGRPHGLFRENSGYWQVNATDDGAASLVTYAIAVRVMLPASVTARGERASLTETIVALRKLVEAR